MNSTEQRRYYWINAKNDTWSWRDILIGEWETFVFFKNGDAPVNEEDFFDVQEDDIFLGYQNTPSTAIVALGKVYSVYYDEENEADGFSITIEKYIDLEHPVTIQDLEDAGGVDITVLQNLSKGIFCLNSDEFTRIISVIERKNPGLLYIVPELSNLSLVDILEEIDTDDALDYAEENCKCNIETNIPVNTIFGHEQAKNRFGINSTGGVCKSERDDSAVLLVDRISNLQWISQNEFLFQIPAREELFDILENYSFPMDRYTERFVLTHSDLDKLVHLLRDEGNGTYRYLGVAQLSIIDATPHNLDSFTMYVRGEINDSLPALPMGVNSSESGEEDDVATIEKGFENIESGAEREVIAKQRLHHSKYRRDLLDTYHDCCLCHVSDEHLLIASHIRPWTECENDREKTDINNGLLLCPNHDRLFDRGFISFDEAGRIMISNALRDDDRIKMNVHPKMHIDISPEINVYMEYHRGNKYIRS